MYFASFTKYDNTQAKKLGFSLDHATIRQLTHTLLRLKPNKLKLAEMALKFLYIYLLYVARISNAMKFKITFLKMEFDIEETDPLRHLIV